MKHFPLWLIILLSMIMLSSCTMQFKAKELELEGHSNRTYEFEKFAWTKPLPLPIKPAD